MTDEQWNQIFEQLRAPLKQGFEAVVEQGQPLVESQIGKASLTASDPKGRLINVETKIVCFLALGPVAALLSSVGVGLKEMHRVGSEQMQEAIQTSQLIVPGKVH